VAVIDADYVVRPAWLRDLVPRRERAHRRRAGSAGLSGRGRECVQGDVPREYRGFFHIGMVTRNERNAIIQHGTMTLVRRSLLERIGWPSGALPRMRNWAAHFEEGYEATYIR